MTGMSLEQIASIAEIIGALTIVSGLVFGWFQIRVYRMQQRDRVAINLMQTFYSPDLARAISLLQKLPDGISTVELRKMGAEYEDAAVIVSTSFETMGLLVYKRIAKFDLVMELAGGIMTSMYRKLAVWLNDIRTEQNQPSWAEWFEWIAQMADKHKAESDPAHKSIVGWKP
jgi:hypothetical protein